MNDRRPLTDSDTARAGTLGWVDDVERATLDNEAFRTVLFTGAQLQLTVMRLAPGEDVGREVHPDIDQFIRVEQGTARLELGPSADEVAERRELAADWAAIIPAGIWHNVVNAGNDELKLYSLYAPPEHPAGRVHQTRRDSEEAHDH